MIEACFDPGTGTAAHLVADPAARACAVIESALGFDPESGRTGTAHADRLADRMLARGLELQSILQAQVHADHLCAAT